MDDEISKVDELLQDQANVAEGWIWSFTCQKKPFDIDQCVHSKMAFAMTKLVTHK